MARPDRAFLAFAAVFFVFHQLPSILFSDRGEAAVDVLTPFAVAAATVAVLLALCHLMLGAATRKVVVQGG